MTIDKNFKAVHACIGDDNKIHLSCIIEYKTPTELRELRVHNMILPLIPENFGILFTTSRLRPSKCYVELNDDRMECIGQNGIDSLIYEDHLIKKLPKQMTIKEIEKILGYSVEIIADH